MATAIAELGSSTRIHRPAAFSARSYCFATVTVQADIRRVLQALMIPEYMEAWIEVPGAERIACVAEGSEPGSFRLEVYTADKRRALICRRQRRKRAGYSPEQIEASLPATPAAHPVRCRQQLTARFAELAELTREAGAVA
jgi:hypothetical protein